MALAGEAWQHVFQLREFDLQAPFGRAGAVGEDIEDQLCPVDDLYPDRLFEIALLRGRQFVIDDEHVCGERFRQLFQLLHLPVSEQRRRVRHGTHLKHFRGNFRPSASPEFGELAKGFGGGGRYRTPAAFEANQNSLFGNLFK